MAYHKLSNYLRTYRKRAGLSQDEIAFLLGCRSFEHISRYEPFRRMPGFRTSLALSVIFQMPTHKIFRGEYQRVEQAACRRAKLLAARLATAYPDQATCHKLARLKTISSPSTQHP